jgi:hypothetical protein
MKDDELERILADDATIAPSAEFSSSVMAAVEREAAAPPALEFPWSRALPGFVATTAALAVAIWQGIDSLNAEQARQLLALATGMELHWLLLAVAITVLSVTLPLKLTRPPRAAPQP